jgi:cytochrome c556
MRHKLVVVAATGLLLAGCNQSPAGDNALAEINASENAAGAAVENVVDASSAAPLPKEEALALMKERHEHYEKIGDSMKVISRELKGDSPDLTVLRREAASIAELAPQVPDWFPEGTGPDVGKTHARAEIWQKPEDFKAKSAAFAAAASKFQASANSSDLAAIRAAHGDLGKSCKACHDLYREKD